MSFSVGTMRPDQSNPLDLNNFPDDYSRDTKLVFDESSSSANYRKKKSGGKDGKDESGKVYECRFCSLKFCKSQALGGHMNRHRQERETETLNRARQLVFSSDNLAAQPPPLGCPSMGPGSYHSAPVEPFRSVYAPRLYSASSSSLLPHTQPPHHHHHNQPYPYTSPSRPPPYSSQYNCGSQPHGNDYYIGQVLGSSHYGAPEPTNHPFIGAPVGGGLGPGSSRGLEGSSGGRVGSIGNPGEGICWGRSYLGAGGGSKQQQSMDSHPSINRFQDGF